MLLFFGGLAFGLVVGWVTYFILRRAQPKALSDLSVLIGAVGGGTITALFDPKGDSFAGYSIGLAVGFFAYYIVFLILTKGAHPIVESLIMKTDEKPTEGQPGPVMGGQAPPVMGGQALRPEAGEIGKETVVWGLRRNRN